MSSHKSTKKGCAPVAVLSDSESLVRFGWMHRAQMPVRPRRGHSSPSSFGRPAHGGSSAALDRGAARTAEPSPSCARATSHADLGALAADDSTLPYFRQRLLLWPPARLQRRLRANPQPHDLFPFASSTRTSIVLRMSSDGLPLVPPWAKPCHLHRDSPSRRDTFRIKQDRALVSPHPSVLPGLFNMSRVAAAAPHNSQGWALSFSSDEAAAGAKWLIREIPLYKCTLHRSDTLFRLTKYRLPVLHERVRIKPKQIIHVVLILRQAGTKTTSHG